MKFSCERIYYALNILLWKKLSWKPNFVFKYCVQCKQVAALVCMDSKRLTRVKSVVVFLRTRLGQNPTLLQINIVLQFLALTILKCTHDCSDCCEHTCNDSLDQMTKKEWSKNPKKHKQRNQRNHRIFVKTRNNDFSRCGLVGVDLWTWNKCWDLLKYR